MSQDTPTRTPGRRSSRSRRRVDVTTVLAVALPVLVALALALVRPGDTPDTTSPPTLTALTRSTVVCPAAAEGAPEVALTSAGEDVSGTVHVGLGDDKSDARIATGEVTTVDAGSGPVVVAAEDETAPGLVAARFGADAPAVASCLAPQPEAWFTGVGAGAGHTSVLELTNPDSGTAVADVLVLGRHGLVDAPRLRGISVPGGSSVQVDLAAEVPRRDELSLQVIAARGRIGATVLDRLAPLGRGAATEDWLPAQSEPATSDLLMGLAPGKETRRVLTVSNGGQDEVRASVQVVTDRSVFTPKDAPDLRIPPQSTAKLNLSGLLADLVADGDATGLLVTATAPVTASLRSVADGDLSHAVADPGVQGGAATVLLPGGTSATKTVLLGGADRAGSVQVVSRSATGETLATDTVDVAPDRGASLRIPAASVLVTVTPARTGVAGSVLLSGDAGAAVVPLTVPALNGLVPAVEPGLP